MFWGVEYIPFVHKKTSAAAIMHTVMNLQVKKKQGAFLESMSDYSLDSQGRWCMELVSCG